MLQMNVSLMVLWDQQSGSIVLGGLIQTGARMGFHRSRALQRRSSSSLVILAAAEFGHYSFVKRCPQRGTSLKIISTASTKDPANSSYKYAILDQFAEFKNPADGTFELKLTWPDRWQIWSQSSNPTTTKTTVDYNAIDVQFPNSFGGLHLNSADPALRESVLDGADDSSTTWFNAVGYEGADWGSKSIPAGNTGDLASGAKQAELYVQRVAE